ncbi:MAG: pyridoxamine 5'-phosphate oxidase, partial [Pseudomonadota bacterium]
DPFAAKADPFDLFINWMDLVGQSEINDPNAMSLATVDGEGVPNVRIVLLKGVDQAPGPDRGFTFYTNLDSQKGRELIGSGHAALLFHWKSVQRQVRIRGQVGQVEDAEADAYYASRARGSRIGAWASQQSRALETREALEARVAEFDAKYPGDDVPRPPHWSGFRLVPAELEFWIDGPFRLHDRIVFRRGSPGGAWETSRLYP